MGIFTLTDATLLSKIFWRLNQIVRVRVRVLLRPFIKMDALLQPSHSSSIKKENHLKTNRNCKYSFRKIILFIILNHFNRHIKSLCKRRSLKCVLFVRQNDAISSISFLYVIKSARHAIHYFLHIICVCKTFYTHMRHCICSENN